MAKNMKSKFYITLAVALILSACSERGQFVNWQDENLGEVRVTESVTKTFVLANNSPDQEQHIKAIAFDQGSNAAGNFRMDKLLVGGKPVSASDIVIPPGSVLRVTVTYQPANLVTTDANWNGWTTGGAKRWIPKSPEAVAADENKKEPVIHRSIIEALYDYPNEGIFYIQLIGFAKEGPNGESEAGGGFLECSPGNGTACYTGGFSLDIPELAPGGPKDLEITGPIKMNINGGAVTMRMDDFPYVIYYLRSADIPQLPSGVTATLVLSGAPGTEADGTFDGSRLEIEGASFRIRVALGELSADSLRSGMSPLIDFIVSDLSITTIKPYDMGKITLHMETKLAQNPSGNELFDQFLSGASVIAIMDGELGM